MIDFTKLEQKNKGYGGANGGKRCLVYQGKPYMIKFPAPPTINKEMSYTNSCICEYIGCHVFELVGIPVQETLLGTYRVNDKEKIVVACGDFTSPGITLQDFASLKNTIVDSERNGYGTELSDIEQTIESQTMIDSKLLSDRFWDMFIVDALIGNWDRHNGNWGFLYNAISDKLILAPVYDCGSSLYPQADEKMMKDILSSADQKNSRIYNVPLSSIKSGDKKINYFKFISSLQHECCNEALKRIVPRIELQKINQMIDDISCISDLQKTFYKTMIAERKEKILDYSLKQLIKQEQGTKTFIKPRGIRL